MITIIEGCALQDRKCQQVLYEKYYGVCLKTAFRYMDTYEQAVEVTNDAFVKMFRNFSRFEIRDRERIEIVLMGWMRRIVINASIDYRRREKHHIESSGNEHQYMEYSDHNRTSDMTVLYKELIRMVRELPPAYRLVFNLHVIEGYSHQEIAKMTGISVGTSKSNLFKAKAQLQKKIKLQDSELILCLT